jgi:hypothetical protein
LAALLTKTADLICKISSSTFRFRKRRIAQLQAKKQCRGHWITVQTFCYHDKTSFQSNPGGYP